MCDPFTDAYYRYDKLQQVKKDLAEKEGGLLNFAKGYEKFGLLKVAGGISYREWAPGAQALYLTGDFSMYHPSHTSSPYISSSSSTFSLPAHSFSYYTHFYSSLTHHNIPHCLLFYLFF